MTHRRLRSTTAIALLALTTASCGGAAASQTTPTESATAAGPSTDAAAAPSTDAKPTGESATSETTTAAVVPRALYSRSVFGNESRGSDLVWRGNMIGSATLDGTEATFRGWVPGMATIAECRPDLWLDNEKPTDDMVVDAAVDMMATTSDTPVVTIAYAATTNASGIDPESTRIYLQTLDLSTCAVGERIDVLGTAIPRDTFATAPKLLASGPTTVAVAPWPRLVTELPALPAVLGINPAERKTTWVKTLPGQQAQGRTTSAGGTAPDGVFDLWHGVASSTDYVRVLIDAETGTELVKSDDFEPPAARLGPDRMVYTTTEKSPNAQSVLSGGKVAGFANGALKEGAVVMDDGKGASVLLGRHCPTSENCSVISDDGGLGYIGAGAAVVTVMDVTRAEDLSLEFLGGSSGRIFVKTSQEHLTLGLDGKQIGSAFDPAEYPYRPIGEKRIGGTLWTLWRVESAHDFAITKDGEPPQAYAAS